MLEGFLHLFARRHWSQVAIDIVDVLLVTYVVYRALLVLRGTRAMQMGTGLGVIFVVYVAAKWAGLVTVVNLLSSLLSSVILIVVVVFQNDIRRGLMRVGSRAFLSGLSRQQETQVIDEVVAAATDLARHRMGALICFEQDANLDEFVVGQGTSIDAAVQRDLLVSLFVPESVNKLHDGAVVIRNFRIAKAGVFFPMPDVRNLDKSLGSRHRAALGITEETDAVVVVVSEERGTISFCFNGNIISGLDGASLRQALLGLFGQGKRDGKKKGDKKATPIPTPAPRASTDRASRTPPPLAQAARAEFGATKIPTPMPARVSVIPPQPQDSVPVQVSAEGLSRPMTPAQPPKSDRPPPPSDRPPPPSPPELREAKSTPMPESARVRAATETTTTTTPTSEKP